MLISPRLDSCYEKLKVCCKDFLLLRNWKANVWKKRHSNWPPSGRLPVNLHFWPWKCQAYFIFPTHEQEIKKEQFCSQWDRYNNLKMSVITNISGTMYESKADSFISGLLRAFYMLINSTLIQGGGDIQYVVRKWIKVSFICSIYICIYSPKLILGKAKLDVSVKISNNPLHWKKRLFVIQNEKKKQLF